MLIKLKKICLFNIIFFGLIIFIMPVQAHLDEIIDLDLSFEKDLQNIVTHAAQEFLHTIEKPKKFDILGGKYAVHFQGNSDEMKKYVLVGPNDYKITGFFNESLLGQGNSQKSSQELFEKAKIFLDSLDLEGKEELYYTGVSDNTFTGVYRYTWHRFLNDYLVITEEFKIDIDSRNQNIIAWDLSIFDAVKEDIDFNNLMSFPEIYKIFTYLEKDAQLVKDFDPVLIVRKDRLEWDFLVEIQNAIVPLKYYVGVDAKSGEINYRSSTIGNDGVYPMQYFVPEEYDKVFDLNKNDLDISISGKDAKGFPSLNVILIFSFVGIIILTLLIIKEKSTTLSN